MYQWGVLQEQIDVWEQENRPMTEAERQRVEYLAELDEQRPSLFERIAGIFRAEPEAEEPLIARSVAEAELIGVLADWDGDRRN
jgi:hypothetical protein